LLEFLEHTIEELQQSFFVEKATELRSKFGSSVWGGWRDNLLGSFGT
jgi:hypothetical protein